MAIRRRFAPQTAEKLGIPQITYAESIVNLEGDEIVVERAFPLGKELVKCTLPCLLTVVASANRPRPPSVRKMIEYKLAATPLEYKVTVEPMARIRDGRKIGRVSRGAQSRKSLSGRRTTSEPTRIRLGLDGSPTQVYKVNFRRAGDNGKQTSASQSRRHRRADARVGQGIYCGIDAVSLRAKRSNPSRNWRSLRHTDRASQ